MRSMKVVKLIKILVYQHQEELLPVRWEIKHILPQKWQTSYFLNTSDSEVKELVEHIGNKIPFEKKQKSYEKLEVQILLDFSSNFDDWGLN